MSFVLIAEPSASVSGALRKFLESAAHEVSIVGTLDEALREVHARAPEVVIASVSDKIDGEALCRRVKQEEPAMPVLLLYLPEEDNPEERAARAGADACLVGPLKRTTVVTCTGLLVQLAEARAGAGAGATEASSAEAAAETEPRRGRPEAHAPDFEFIKRLLLMEVKRSRRYRYPIALLVTELDQLAERTAGLTAAQRTAVLAEVLGVLSGGVRDIDVVVPATEGRFVAFLPHTPRGGAIVVAERLLERLKKLAPLPELTGSVGLAVFEPLAGLRGQTQVSFGNLMKAASEALRRAQAAGGDRVEVAELTAKPGSPK